jgi:hypothetical protein
MKRSFLRKQPKEYHEAVAALCSLGDAGDWDLVLRAFAETVADRRRENFARHYGVTPSRSGHPCVNRLLGKPCRDICPPIPGSDHTSLWLKGGRPWGIVTQPYGISSVHQMAEFAGRYNLEMTVDAWLSWHFPGSTVLVLFKKK